MGDGSPNAKAVENDRAGDCTGESRTKKAGGGMMAGTGRAGMEADRKGRSGKAVAIIAVGVLLAIAAAYLFFKGSTGESVGVTHPTSRPTVRAAMKAATRPKTVAKRVVPAPFLESPKKFAEATDKRIGDLIESHNRLQDRISNALLKGTC